MKVCHLTTMLGGGGASIATARLHRALRGLGVDSLVFGRHGDPVEPGMKRWEHPAFKPLRILLKLRRRNQKRTLDRAGANHPGNPALFSMDRGDIHDLVKQLPESDIMHLHWVTGIPQWHVGALIDVPSFFHSCRPRAKIVWTLHDMNPFTGGCHASLGCLRFAHGCGNCPQLNDSRCGDLSAQIARRKSRALRPFKNTNRLVFVANSEWTARTAAQSPILSGHSLKTIHPGIDPTIFQSLNREECRRILGVPFASRVVAFGAVSVDSQLKGAGTILEWVRATGQDEKMHFLTFGSGQVSSWPSKSVTHLGAITNERMMAVVYNAADVFVAPSLAEPFGQTAAEALACGTPVVASDVGGLPEIVESGVSGELVPPKDPAALGRAVARILEGDAYRASLSVEGRKRVLTRFNASDQAQKYVELYHDLCSVR